jgi:uncharacterized protein (DUF433 family)
VLREIAVVGGGVILAGWRDYIVSAPNICHGQACIKGTRIPVAVILDNRAMATQANR